MKPVIGIVCREYIDEARPWYPPAQGVMSGYIHAVYRAGGVPMIIPILDDSEAMSQLYRKVDGVLLAGGGDVHPAFYRERPRVVLDRPDIIKDKVELTMASWAVLDQKPLLGICRGMQIINVSLGGSLHQDLHQVYATQINHDESFENKNFSYLVHNLLIKEQSRLAAILQTPKLPINSLHRQAIKELASTLTAVGWADDGVIEAVESNTSHYVLGIQAHPEIMATQNSVWNNVFKDFVQASTARVNV